MHHATDRLDDARFFPLDYDAEADEFLLLDCDLDTLGRTTFLDRRLAVDWAAATRVDARTIAPGGAPAFLFHTAFCCSTLLARALHAPPASVALKEPYVLMSLSSPALAGRGDAWLDQRIAAALRLLARPWAPGGGVVVKPTNVVNRLLPRLVASGGSRAVLLYSSLREFLVSCAKKLPDAETRIRWMAQHLLPGSALQRVLGVPADHPFNFVESCVLTWHAQVERYAEALALDGGRNLRTLDMDVLLARPRETVAACVEWLALDGAREGLDARVATEFSRHAKSTDQPFDPAQRAKEKARVLAHYGALVDQAEAWARQAIAPAARMPREWFPLEVA